jgi:IclR family pca regulon transcriptional regulator
VPTLREPRYSQSLERGLAILRVFTPERPVLGIAEIASELGMSRSTTHRYMITLLALGYLEQGSSRKYRLGLGVTRLGMSALASVTLNEHARGCLEELREHCPYTNYLGVLDGTEVLLLARIPGLRRARHPLELSHRSGSRLPSYCTAVGKVLLAHVPEEEQRSLLAAMTLEPYGPRTITSRRELREELSRVREDGLANSHEEMAANLYAIAAPVRDESGEVIAAVNVIASDAAVEPGELAQEAGPQVRATARRISERLGYRPSGTAPH